MPPDKVTLDPSEKVVMITACDTGLGYKIARKLDEIGFNVIACCLFPEGEGAQKLVQETSGKLRIIGLDVTSDESCLAAHEEVQHMIKNRNTGKYSIILMSCSDKENCHSNSIFTTPISSQPRLQARDSSS